MENETKSIQALWQQFKKVVMLNVLSAKLVAIERLTYLFATIALFFVMTLLGIITIVFMTISLCYLLDTFINDIQYVYMIIALIYMILIFLVYCARKVLFYNPISRFLSKLLLNSVK